MVHRVLAGFAGAVALSLSLPVGSSAAAPAAPAREMASLQYLVGTWHCTWTSGKQSGAEDQIFESVMGGSWLEGKEIVTDAAGEPMIRSIHYTGFDPKKKAYVHLGPNANGSYEIAQSADTEVWHAVPEGPGALTHPKLSETKRTAVETYESQGKTVRFVMTCDKVR